MSRMIEVKQYVPVNWQPMGVGVNDFILVLLSSNNAVT